MFNSHTFRTWPFILLVLTNVAAWLATTGSTVSSHNAYLFTAFSAAAYALARGLAKQNTDTKDWWKTSEVWVVVIGAAVAFVGDLNGHVSDTLLKEILAGLTAASMIARGIALDPITQVVPPVETTTDARGVRRVEGRGGYPSGGAT